MVCLVNKRGGSLMKKIVVSIISFVLTKVVVDFIGMQLIKLFVLKDFDFTVEDTGFDVTGIN